MTLPTDEEIWERVRAFAADCKANNTPVHTLKKGVKNLITEVTETRIGRHSDDGRQDKAHTPISKREVIAQWHFLTGKAPDPDTLYFVPALMVAALPDLLEAPEGRARLIAQRKDSEPRGGKVNQEQRAALVWDFLQQKAREGRLTSYSDVEAATGIHHRHLGRPLDLVEEACAREKTPRLAILAVDKTEMKPGRGFLWEEGYSLEEEIARVYAFPWHTLRNPFEYARAGETEESLARQLLSGPDHSLDVYRRVRVRGPAQKIFRTALLDAYGRACAFCGFAVEESLEAAHIHAWAKCGERDRMNPRNGLLLCANHHRMFDAHKIRITPDYKLSCASTTVASQMGSLHLNEQLHLPGLAHLHPDPRLIGLRYATGS